MIRRSFGNGVRVSVLGIGCGRVGSISNAVSMREIEATLEVAVEAGINLFDTADIYGQGDSERTLSRLLRRHGDSLFVVTKVGGATAASLEWRDSLNRCCGLLSGRGPAGATPL